MGQPLFPVELPAREGRPVVQPPSPLSELARLFAEIPLDDFVASRKYIKEHPDILDTEPKLLIEHAQANLVQEKDLFSKQLVQRAILIGQCKFRRKTNDSQMRDYLRDLAGQVRTSIKEFDGRFHDAWTLVTEQAEAKKTEIPKPPDRTRAPSADRHDPTTRLPTTKGTLGELSLLGAEPEIKQSSERDKIARFLRLDHRYRRREDAAQFFHVGRVFAILWHENPGSSSAIGRDLGNPIARTRGTSVGIYGEWIYSHIRRMVVVAQRHGYCWCVPIYTYGHRGVLGKNLRPAEHEAHAVAYMSTEKPTSRSELEMEKLTKDPIAIDMLGTCTLDPMRRINFGIVHTVEWNVKVMNVGSVAEVSMHLVQDYFRNEFFR